MKIKLLLLCALAHAGAAFAQVFPVNNIISNGPDTNRINLVFLPDGFQSNELVSFNTNVASIQAYIFGQTPFKEYARFFNVHAIQVPSPASGVVHPGTATDVPEPAFPIAHPNTYFGSSFDNGHVHRAVTALNSSAVYGVLNASYPMYDVPMVLVNTPEYGGTGGNYLTFTINTSANETAVHELGHTFGKLWDEYWNNMPGEHPNMTQQNDPAQIIWKNWLNTNGIDIYPYGASAPQSLWFRPHDNCKMQFLGKPLCAVCRENIIDRIYEKVKPIESFSPDTINTIKVTAPTYTFSFQPILPEPNTLKYTWLLNGNVINTTDTFVQLTQAQIGIGTPGLVAVITDTTLMSRSYLPAQGYMFSVQWNLSQEWPASVSSIKADNKFVYKLFPVPATDKLNLYCNNSTNATELQYEITAITGSIAKKGSLAMKPGEQTLPLEITGLAAGTYNCTLKGEGIYVNTKFIVE